MTKTPQEELMRRIEKLGKNEVSWYMPDYDKIQAHNNALSKAISTIKSFLKGKVILDKASPKSRKAVEEWLGGRFVDGKDLPTKEELDHFDMGCANNACSICLSIHRKLKALGGKA